MIYKIEKMISRFWGQNLTGKFEKIEESYKQICVLSKNTPYTL